MINLVFYVDVLVVGGIEKVLIELLKNIDSTKFKVTLLIGYKMDELEKLKGDIPENINVEYVFHERFYTSLKKKKIMGRLNKLEKVLFESYSLLRKLVLKNRIKKMIKDKDILIDYDMTLSPFINELNIRKAAFCHFSLKNYNRGIKRRQIRLGKRLALYNKVFVISGEMEKEAIEMFPFLSDRVVKLYNSFNIDKIKEKAATPIEIKDKYILAIGRLEETQKDFTTLIKGYAQVANLIDEKLYIIGDGRHKEILQNLAKELGIEDKVVFLGFISNPYPYIKSASLFIHSSKFEGLPTVLIEALILEKIIIATDCPTGPKEILNNGKNGILVNVGAPDEIALGIKKVLLDREDTSEYIKNMRIWVDEFDSKKVLKKFENIITNDL